MENKCPENTFCPHRTIIKLEPMNSSRQSGKISLLSLGAVAIVAMIAASMAFAKEDPSAVGAQFMDALARHDVDKLTELSMVSKTDPAGIEAEKKRLHDDWAFSVNVAGEHYPFTWRITESAAATDTHSAVTVQITKLVANDYEEKYELTLEKVNNKWMVDVGAISRTMFPALPK